MKIAKSKLQQIIQEELSRVLKEEHNPDYDKVFMVITKLSGGGLEFWPRESKPDFYNSFDDAHAVAKKISKSNVENKFYRAVNVTEVLGLLTSDRRLGSIKQLAQTYLDKNVETGNADKNADGALDREELEAIAKSLEG